MRTDGQFERKGRVFGKNRGFAGVFLLLVILISIFGIVTYAVTDTINVFSGKESLFNMTWGDETNQTEILSVPLYAYATNITITVRGIDNNP